MKVCQITLDLVVAVDFYQDVGGFDVAVVSSTSMKITHALSYLEQQVVFLVVIQQSTH